MIYFIVIGLIIAVIWTGLMYAVLRAFESIMKYE